MANWIWKTKEDKDQGFSLVELLIVVIIMGILAAIAIPLFLSQRAKAEDKHAQSDVRILATEISTFYADAPASATLTVTLSTSTHKYTITDTTASPTVVYSTMPASKNVTNVKFSYTGTAGVGSGGNDSTWCIRVENPAGKEAAYSMSPGGGMNGGSSAEACT
ncbi:MAG: type II secretion system protein [Bifidobacteriaceae bacterium]|jgi:prepilin-type N-terminal cleavage/methylation domain-containing protein|nr:type II secretion system protein [Bifidobacteriaceae bacterium]